MTTKASIFTVSSPSRGTIEKLRHLFFMLDSGSMVHTVPLKYKVSPEPLLPCLPGLTMYTASGSPLGYHGRRTMTLGLTDELDDGGVGDGIDIDVVVEVTSVTRPILSVSKLSCRGFTVMLGKRHSFLITPQWRWIRLYHIGNLWYLPVQSVTISTGKRSQFVNSVDLRTSRRLLSLAASKTTTTTTPTSTTTTKMATVAPVPMKSNSYVRRSALANASSSLPSAQSSAGERGRDDIDDGVVVDGAALSSQAQNDFGDDVMDDGYAFVGDETNTHSRERVHPIAHSSSSKSSSSSSHPNPPSSSSSSTSRSSPPTTTTDTKSTAGGGHVDDETTDLQAKTATHVGLPPEEVQMRHRLTHLPFASWCDTCKSARSKEDHHIRRTLKGVDDIPRVQSDYSRLDGMNITVLSI